MLWEWMGKMRGDNEEGENVENEKEQLTRHLYHPFGGRREYRYVLEKESS
jgi:hypothetical protein